MSIERITISMPSAVAARIKKAAGDTPVSAWVTEVIEDRLDDAGSSGCGWRSTRASARVVPTFGARTRSSAA